MATELILGNITFDLVESIAIVHEVLGIIICENVDEADKIVNELINFFPAYLIPDAYAGKIIWECEKSLQCMQQSQSSIEQENKNKQMTIFDIEGV